MTESHKPFVQTRVENLRIRKFNDSRLRVKTKAVQYLPFYVMHTMVGNPRPICIRQDQAWVTDHGSDVLHTIQFCCGNIIYSNKYRLSVLGTVRPR